MTITLFSFIHNFIQVFLAEVEQSQRKIFVRDTLNQFKFMIVFNEDFIYALFMICKNIESYI